MNKSPSGGFTLVELMVTVVILSIIVGIAYPSFRNYMTQTRRSDAKVALTQTANRLEKYFSICNSYPTSLNLTSDWPGQGAAANCPPDDGTQGLGVPDNDSPDDHYTLTLTAGTIAGVGTIATTYTLTANPAGGGLQVGDGPLRIDSTGRQQWDRNDDAGWCCSWTDK
ncbi:MAG: type IV pilin protein [Acidiferrobacterales bacterium]